MNANKQFNWIRGAGLILVPAAMFGLASCASKPLATNLGPVHSYADEAGGIGYAGQNLVQTTETNAAVISIDVPTRRLGLRYPDGRSTIYRAGPEVANFGKIKVGDQVKATVTEELGVSVVAADAATATTNQAAVFRSPTRQELGPKPIATMKFTGRILTLDPFERRVTIQLPGGTTLMIKVRDGIQMGALNPGDEISVLVTEAMTITIQTP